MSGQRQSFVIKDLHTDLVATGKAAVTAMKAEMIERRDAVFILECSLTLLLVNV